MSQDRAWRDDDAAADPVGATHPGRVVMPDRDVVTNLGQISRSQQQAYGGALGQIADGFWRVALAPVRVARRRFGWRAIAASAPAGGAQSLQEFLQEREQRRRLDLALAAGAGVAVAAGVLVLADGLPERSTAAILARQGWWLAGGFWAGFTWLVRRWLDQ